MQFLGPQRHQASTLLKAGPDLLPQPAIYLDAAMQERLMRSFHYGLRPDGHLVLGSSESVMRATKLFRVKDKKHRIFERRDAPIAALPPFSTGVSGGDRTALDAQAISNDGALDASIRRAMDKHNPPHPLLDRANHIGQAYSASPTHT